MCLLYKGKDNHESTKERKHEIKDFFVPSYFRAFVMEMDFTVRRAP